MIFWFLKKSKMAAWWSFWTFCYCQFAHQQWDLPCGCTDLLKIFHRNCTRFVVDACLFWLLKKSKMAVWQSLSAVLLHNLYISAWFTDMAGRIYLKFCMVLALGVKLMHVLLLKIFKMAAWWSFFGHFCCIICTSVPGSPMWLYRFILNFAW